MEDEYPMEYWKGYKARFEMSKATDRNSQSHEFSMSGSMKIGKVPLIIDSLYVAAPGI